MIFWVTYKETTMSATHDLTVCENGIDSDCKECCKQVLQTYERRCRPVLQTNKLNGIRIPLVCQQCGCSFRVTFTYNDAQYTEPM